MPKPKNPSDPLLDESKLFEVKGEPQPESFKKLAEMLRDRMRPLSNLDTRRLAMQYLNAFLVEYKRAMAKQQLDSANDKITEVANLNTHLSEANRRLAADVKDIPKVAGVVKEMQQLSDALTVKLNAMLVTVDRRVAEFLGAASNKPGDTGAQ